jgi:membrane fusion protein (multidrug efflux system)
MVIARAVLHGLRAASLVLCVLGMPALCGDFAWGDEYTMPPVAAVEYPDRRPSEFPEATAIPGIGFDLPETSVEAVVINPFRSATVGTDISGIIEAVNFEEGDFIAEGQVVAEISRRRYTLTAEKADEAVNGMRCALLRAEQQLRLMRRLLVKGATTQQELLKAETEHDVAISKLRQTEKEAELARLNVDASVVKAPFSGYMAFRHKQPFEPIERLEKIFTLIDTRSVYATANVAERMLDVFKKGIEASFTESTGKIYKGRIERIGKVIDVKSRTKKIYVLISNTDSQLEVGMSGTLRPASDRK